MGVDPASLWSMADIHRAAIERLDADILRLIDGGAGDGAAIRGNEAGFAHYALRPRVLTGVEKVSLATTVLGRNIAAPLLFAPSGLHGLAHPDGELATARAAQTAGLAMVLSTHSSIAVDDVGKIVDPLWFQFYWGRDRAAVRALIERAQRAGASALCLTLDMPTRPWIDAAMHRAVAAIAHIEPAHGTPRSMHLQAMASWDHDARLTWDDLGWLRSVTTLPLVLKGIMTAQDATLAVQHGADAIIVSNHGGRVLEYGQATIAVLPEIVDAVAGRIEVYIDGGVRSGSHIAIALGLGARAVLIGRPVQWGLALAGSQGVGRVVALLLAELTSVMAMLGAAGPGQICRAHIAEVFRR